MEGMDGYELIRKIREIDQDCAIIIITCMNDFEALRSMMGYHISGYILKASMTMEEISGILEKVQSYLKRMWPEEEGRKEKTPIHTGRSDLFMSAYFAEASCALTLRDN